MPIRLKNKANKHNLFNFFKQKLQNKIFKDTKLKDYKKDRIQALHDCGRCGVEISLKIQQSKRVILSYLNNSLAYEIKKSLGRRPLDKRRGEKSLI